MAEIEKVIEDLESIKRTLYNLTGSHMNERKVDNAIRTIRDLQEDCNRYHEWGMHEGYEEAKEKYKCKWHYVADGDLPTTEQYITNNGLFIVSDGNRVYSEWFDIYDNKLFGEPTIERFRVDRCVIAWMELPKFSEVE